MEGPRSGIDRCIEKLAQAEGGSVCPDAPSKDYRHSYKSVNLKGRTHYDGHALYRELFNILDEDFRSYHASRVRTAYSLDEIGRMDGVEFENFLMGQLKTGGFEVSGTPKSGDKGADIIAQKAGRVIVIQAKRSAAEVGVRAIQEVRAALAYYGGTEAWVITNSTFTQPARDLASRNDVRLIDGTDLPRLIDALR